MKFNSQICTSREQSERLLALGLKKETADMYLQRVLNNEWSPFIPIAFPYSDRPEEIIAPNVVNVIPAWSLHRLIEMIQSIFIRVNLCGWWVQIERKLFHEEYYGNKYNNLYENLIDCIEWLIMEGHFSKLYLERKE